MKKTSPKLFCFVLMPFDPAFEDVYKLGIKEACSKAGAYCERVDEQMYDESILERIYNQIAKADVVIADMTGRNPNVFYEVGYAHALGKRTILLTRDASDIPFDLKHYPHIVYGNVTKLREELKKKVEWCLENPSDGGEPQTIGIELFHDGKNLSAEKVLFVYRKSIESSWPSPSIVIHNNSTHTFLPGSFKMAMVTSEYFRNATFYSGQSDVYSTTLPDGRRHHLLPDFDALFPEQYTSIAPSFMAKVGRTDFAIGEEEILFKIYTTFGTREYKLTLICQP